jgi:predicted  nucleic acid-binding Zn-ribbon protein
MKTALAILATSAAYANPAAAAVKTAGAPKAEDRVAAVFAAVRTDIKPPVSAKRGVKSELAEKLLALPVDGSIGIANKSKKQISSSISKVNNHESNLTNKIGADGAVLMQPGAALKDANGAIVGNAAATPVKERIKEFAAYDVNAKTDPDNASVRIFRIK